MTTTRSSSGAPVPPVVAVVGPTGSGKSEVALAIAEAADGEVVNIDSMQLYSGMDIGTAKLPVDLRRGIVHHQFDVLDVTETASVAAYRDAAVADVEDIRKRGRTPVIVGGSMMYVQALLDEWDLPPTDPQVRARWEAELQRIGVEALHQRLGEIDPEAAKVIETRDPRRTVRALGHRAHRASLCRFAAADVHPLGHQDRAGRRRGSIDWRRCRPCSTPLLDEFAHFARGCDGTPPPARRSARIRPPRR